ncbi:MAG TPA: phosphatidylglycerol lysyltransferase domain-containing protein [Syntrophales bacterium]|nr:phosphatidylglycerol lysyltransferase domain-containing protein [Syntrophales bacterium]
MIFKPIVPADYTHLTSFFSEQRYQLCPYSLSSIIVWKNEVYQPYGAIHNDSLLVYANFTRHKERSYLILPISPGRESSPEELSHISSQTGYGTYCFVPEDYIERHGKSTIEKYFVVEQQDGYDDYVYRTEDLATLAGNRYSKKRNLVKQFERNYLDQGGAVTIKTISPEDVPGCLEFLERWCEERDCDVDRDEDLACEWNATRNALYNIDTLGFSGIMLSIDGITQAFGIASQLTETMSVLHFQKASAQFKGLYQFFDRECARRLFSELQFINKESDMGVPGMAQTKHSYHPVMMIRSYKLSLRE